MGSSGQNDAAIDDHNAAIDLPGAPPEQVAAAKADLAVTLLASGMAVLRSRAVQLLIDAERFFAGIGDDDGKAGIQRVREHYGL